MFRSLASVSCGDKNANNLMHILSLRIEIPYFLKEDISGMASLCRYLVENFL